MMSENKSVRKVRQHFDRVTLNEAALQKINHWLEQVNEVLRGQSITRSDMINWLVLRNNQALSESELKDIHQKLFDPVKALAWATRKAKEAIKRGEEIKLNDLISSSFKSQPKEKAEKKKKPNTPAIEVPKAE